MFGEVAWEQNQKPADGIRGVQPRATSRIWYIFYFANPSLLVIAVTIAGNYDNCGNYHKGKASIPLP